MLVSSVKVAVTAERKICTCAAFRALAICSNQLAMQAADLQKACAIGRDDPGSDLAPTQADFQDRVHSLAAQLMQVNTLRAPLLHCLQGSA